MVLGIAYPLQAVGEEEAGPAEPPALEESAQVEQAAEEDTPAAQVCSHHPSRYDHADRIFGCRCDLLS